jgi:DNA polymerase-3 subunit epsilon
MKMLLFRLKKLYYLHRLRRKNLPPVIRDHLQASLRLDFRQRIHETAFVVFDTETTGLHVRKGDRIVSISAVRLKQGRIDLSDTFHELINPNRDIPSKAAVIHGILPRMVNGKPPFEEILPKFIDYIGSSVLVAHHAWLDMTFLNREMIRLYGIRIQNVVLDTAILDLAFLFMRASLSRKSTVKVDSSLGALSERYHVSIEERHSSFGDALATAQIFQQMVKEAQSHGILLLKDLFRIAFQPPSMDMQSQDVSPM